MLTVVTHQPSPGMQECELTFLENQRIDLELAASQHVEYRKMLESCGARVITLTDNLDLPDSVFVEDPIIVFDEVAVLTSMGVESRRRESAALESYFKHHREIERIKLPARIEGGDVLKIGRRIYVGESPRTNGEGIRSLARILEPYGYRIIPVQVNGCLHLKTGCTALDEQTLILNPAWVDPSQFAGYRIVETPPGEPFGANVLPIATTICMNEAFPQTLYLVKELGYNVRSTNISEFVKAEAGLTCMSIPFQSL